MNIVKSIPAILVLLSLIIPATRAQGSTENADSQRLHVTHGERKKHFATKQAKRRQAKRHIYINSAYLIEQLNIKKGMTIVDIGSGPGYATFILAQKLSGTGEVFATDINSNYLEILQSEAKIRKLNNITAVKVKDDGFDPFYTKHLYDLAFLSNVYHSINDRLNYFASLKSRLKPNGELVIVLYNQSPLFCADDFEDLMMLEKSLLLEPEDSPFVKNLSDVTKALLASRRKNKNSQTPLVNNLIEDFNRMLKDPRFFMNFYHDRYFQAQWLSPIPKAGKTDAFSPTEREMVNWLMMDLAESASWDLPKEKLDERTMRKFIKLNRIFFTKRFPNLFRNNGLGPRLPAGDANRMMSKFVAIRELESIGYQLKKEITLSTIYEAIIMAPKKTP